MSTPDNKPEPEKLVRVEDVAWIRARRRAATTASDHQVVRAQLRELDKNIAAHPAPSTSTTIGMIVVGLVIIVVGILVGIVVFGWADSMWTYLTS